MTRNESSLSIERLRSILNYDAETGGFRWAVRRGGRAIVGSVAGSITTDGHQSIKIDKVLYQSHRLAWAYVTGAWPVDEIDHINRVRDDNRFANLRAATRFQNMVNKLPRQNASGLPRGVRRTSRSSSTYCARITFERRTYNLGYFRTVEEALAAYEARAVVLHGEFRAG